MINVITSVFPALSSVMIMLNLRRAFIDEEIKGISLYSLGFFTIYAGWMVFYFYHVDATYPMYTAIANFLANSAYGSAAIYYTRRLHARPLIIEDT